MADPARLHAVVHSSCASWAPIPSLSYGHAGCVSATVMSNTITAPDSDFYYLTGFPEPEAVAC